MANPLESALVLFPFIAFLGAWRAVWRRSQDPREPEAQRSDRTDGNREPEYRSHSERPNDAATGFPALLLEAWVFCIPLLCISISLKFLVLRESGDVHAGLNFTYLRMYAGEIWESLVIMPAALIVLGWALPLIWGRLRGWRRWIYFVCIELVLLDALIQWATYREMGEFPTQNLAGDFLATLRSNPAFLSPTSLLDKKERLMFVVALLSGLAPVLFSYLAMPRVRTVWSRHYKVAFVIVALALLVVGMAPMGVSGANFGRVGTLERTVAEILKSEDSEDVITPEETRWPKKLYERVAFPGGIAAEKASQESVRQNATIKGGRPNVVFIVLETAGWKDYPLSGPNCRMPNVAALLPHALVANNHFSTDVESLRANLSIYTSLYDLPGEGQAQYFGKHLVGIPARPLDALPRILAGRGYATRYYFPSLLWPKVFEEDSLHLYGFQAVRMVNAVAVPRDPQEELDQWNQMTVLSSAAEKMDAERKMYEMAMQDITEFTVQGQPFFVAIAGSIGHAPFADVRPTDEIAKEPNPGREAVVGNIAAFQDQLIGALLDKLKQLGLMDNTIFLVTGDHGPRTRLDDPELDLNASEENYHVPLLIHFPGTFAKTVYVNRLTSHLDVAPTVLELMGLHPRDYMQEGLSMFDPALDDRITYFLGRHMRGFDSLYYRGQFMMYSYTRNLTYLSNSFRFQPENQIDAASASADVKRMYAALLGLRHVQKAWISYLRKLPSEAGR